MKIRILGSLAIAAFAAMSGHSRAADLTTLVSFNVTNGADPAAGLIADTSGNLFGTTQEGGTNGYGTLFEIAKTSTGYATPISLLSFNGPVGNLEVADVNGNLFGTALQGAGNGIVFEITKTASSYTSPIILYSFCALPGCVDGVDLNPGLVIDANGNLFGTTSGGGANGLGTVFEIAKTSTGYASAPTTLVNFGVVNPLSDPSTGLIADANGNLWGGAITTAESLLFEIAKTSSGYASSPNGVAVLLDAGFVGPPTIDANGNLFAAIGRITGGDIQLENGAVVEVAKTTSGYAPSILYFFCNPLSHPAACTDGAGPNAGLVVDANGNLFGTTFGGGTNDLGTVFEIANTSSGYASAPTTLVSFDGSNGAHPSGLIADAVGNLFGTTSEGGAYGSGTVFKLQTFAGLPGQPTCVANSISTLVQKYGGLLGAAAALSYPNVPALQAAIMAYCDGSGRVASTLP